MDASPAELAWAAGLFDGEGSSSMFVPYRRLTARRQIQVSQAGTSGSPPEVLVRFRKVVGIGNVTGPYRGGIFYWKTTRKDAVDAVAAALWPYLGATKRTQFEAMTAAAGRRLPLLPLPDRASNTELAWAGLFDGEGSIFVRTSGHGPRINLEISQAGQFGMPETLIRFRRAVDAGWLNGPYPPRSPWTRLPSGVSHRAT